MVGRVVVGVDGQPSGWRALAVAVEEARTHNAVLDIRHCWQAPREATAPSGTVMPIVSLGARPSAAAEQVTASALRRATDSLPPDHRVRAELLEGPPGAALSECVGPDDMLVVGVRSRNRLTARWLGSTTSRVLNQAESTVVVVPPPAPPGDGPFPGHVVLGIAPSRATTAVLRLGFDEARAHESPVAAVHAVANAEPDSYIDERTLEVRLTPFPPEYGDLKHVLEHWEHTNPAVPVRRAVFHGSPSQALARASVGAKALVLGRVHRSAPCRGVEPLAERLIGHVGCPVALTPFAVA
ncbi:universal stress protein [Allokutzneria oryzae]|uniref:Universal stress protein n=1 Tax=Allokutzneria oryzae TaxID=1378989 RepID=A0ABV5ZWV8_9PSEU